MPNHWLLTNTCYGTRLPGDRRGFVSNVRDHRPSDRSRAARVMHNSPGTPHDADIPDLEDAARAQSLGSPLYLTFEHAEVFLVQLKETARVRKWELLAAAIMRDHFHLVVGADDDVTPAKILGDFKSWGTRALNGRFGIPPSETWWTERGSKRLLYNARAIEWAVTYVLRRQPSPLLVWPKGPI